VSRTGLAVAAVLAWVAAFPGGADAATEDDRLLFESCTILYQANRYDDAADCYRSLLDGGVQNGPVHANLANAYMHLERHGEAVYHYRQAQLFLPRDSEVRGHLSRALAAAGMEREPPRPAASRVLFFYDRLSPGELWGIAAILNLVLWGLLIIRLYRRGEIVTWAALVVGAGLLLFASTAAVRTVELTTRPGAVVLSGTAVARSARDRSASGMFRLPEGSEVVVTARQGDWIAIEADHGRRGWIEAAALGVIEYARLGSVGRDRDGAGR
jgi:tetratricopeptide (TPR) repeat protein